MTIEGLATASKCKEDEWEPNGPTFKIQGKKEMVQYLVTQKITRIVYVAHSDILDNLK